MNQMRTELSLTSAGETLRCVIPIGEVVEKTDVFQELCYFFSVNFKLEKRLTPWINRNFRYYLLISEKNKNVVTLVVQNKNVKDYPTLCFYSNKDNIELVINDLTEQFKNFCNKPTNVKLNKKNIVLNRWWKNYIGNLKII